MKNIFLILLIVVLIVPVFGFGGMIEENQETALELTDTTESDLDIVLMQHLIEIDTMQIQENKIFVRETLIFKNIGNKNFSGSLRTWLPDGAVIIKDGEWDIEKSNMITGSSTFFKATQNGNIITWHDGLESDTTASLYLIEYTIPSELSNEILFSKKLSYPTLINYRYMDFPGFAPIVIKVTKPASDSIKLQDENRNKITPQDSSQEGNSVLERFTSPKFKEINIIISKPSVPFSDNLVYVIPGILILLVLLYPSIRKKFEKKKEIIAQQEEKLEDDDNDEFEGKTKDELESEKKKLLEKLSKFDKDYESGVLLDEEYDEKRRLYLKKMKKISKRINELK